MDNPLVSVCMPVYNGGRFIDEAIRSVLAQTYRNFELQIFDDASTDDTWTRLQKIHDARVIIHRNDRNIGPEANWNHAIACASGKYIKLFHQDDLLAPDCLARQVEALDRDPASVLAFCRRTIIRADGRKLMTRGAPWAMGAVDAREVIRRCALAGTNLLGEPSAILFRVDTARKVGGFDSSIPYLIDLDYWVRLLAWGQAVYLDVPLVSFRISGAQWSASIGLSQGREFVAFLGRHGQDLGGWRGGWIRLFGVGMAHVNSLARALFYRLLE